MSSTNPLPDDPDFVFNPLSPEYDRDPYPIPAVLREHAPITRTPHDMSSFGVGRHFCIGAQLARLELEIALGRVVERLSDFQLKGSFDSIPYRTNPAVRGPEALPIRFKPDAQVDAKPVDVGA